MPDLKLVPRVLPSPHVLSGGTIDASAADPRLRSAEEVVIVSSRRPPKPGGYVVWSNSDGRPRLAIYAGHRNGWPRLKRWDGVPLAAVPLVMVKVMFFVLESEVIDGSPS